MAGWSSANKYSLMGGLRAAGQLIAYELPLLLAVVAVVVQAGTMSMVGIVEAQYLQGTWFLFKFFPLGLVAFFIYMVAGVAESNRNPFDLPEAENELGAGYHTEYSGMRFGLFFLGEYVHMQVLGALTAVFFLGGWRGPLLPPVPVARSR